MNKGVEILLARMESNPEEFAIRMNYGESQWSGLINMFKHCLDQEDMDALEAGARKCNQEMFTRKVMEALLDPKEESQSATSSIGMAGATLGTWGNGLTTNALYQSAQAQQALVATNATGTVTLPSGSITLGKTTLQEQQLQQLLEMKLEVDKQKHQTIVGKLYNYLGVNK